MTRKNKTKKVTKKFHQKTMPEFLDVLSDTETRYFLDLENFFKLCGGKNQNFVIFITFFTL